MSVLGPTVGDMTRSVQALAHATDVDVNDPPREALSRPSGDDPPHPRVGPDESAVTTTGGSMVGQKGLPLPDRWLRGFAEARTACAGFGLRAQTPAVEAVRFLRPLPGGAAARGPMRVVPAGRAPRPTARPVPGAVWLAGPDRSPALRRMLRCATALRVYGPDTGGRAGGAEGAASAREAALPGMRLTPTLPPEPSRGFSGEGGALEAPAVPEAADLSGEPAAVVSGGRRYRVRTADGALTCTCRWWTDHRGGRGPCGHAPAVRMARRGTRTAGGAR